ncbi:MAG TPA: hypothetical protein VM662_11075 [Sphingomonas sp.]|nr:hypothetical protein [Sphingomonas sp.]
MASDEYQLALESADARAALQSLRSSWPATLTLRPASIGLRTPFEHGLDFVRAVQRLSDAGLIAYEALVVGPDGPRVIDAVLTARGRALVSSWLSTNDDVHQLAG